MSVEVLLKNKNKKSYEIFLHPNKFNWSWIRKGGKMRKGNKSSEFRIS